MSELPSAAANQEADRNRAAAAAGRLDPWIVGGPGRCGKTHLVLTLWRLEGPVAGFPLEGLFTVYSRRRFPFFRARSRQILEEYLTRSRFIDVERHTSESPLAYFSSSISDLKAALPEERGHPVALIGWALSRFARENGRRTWAAFDLHPEFLYPRFRRRLPGLRLAVMVRDPREAICAMLFWRGDPGGGAERDARFKHSLILWCLGVQTGSALARRWPDDVHLFDFNALVSGDESEFAHVARCFGLDVGAVRKAYDIRPHFQYTAGEGFLAPDGRSAMLLRAGELSEIAILAGPYDRKAATDVRTVPNGPRPRRGFLLFARAVLTLGRVTPGFARAIVDFAYYPHRSTRRRVNGLYRRVKDLARGLRLSVSFGGRREAGRRRPLFFVVSGAHGVGKSTAIEACDALLRERGVAVRRFHHIVDGRPDKTTAARQRPDKQTVGHGAASWWRSIVPKPVKRLITSALDELCYVRGINRILAEAASRDRIALSDRYAYDRLVDLRLRRRPLIQRLAVRVVCALMRRPTLTILLTDDPAAVRERKQELTEEEIARYQNDLAVLCERVGAPFVVVRVNGRDPGSVAAEIVDEIVERARESGYRVPAASATSCRWSAKR